MVGVMSEQRFDYARVYIGPEPTDGGPHPGYRGPVTVSGHGVLIHESCEWLCVVLRGDVAPMTLVAESEWLAVETPVLVPWHRVHSIEPEHNQQGG